MKTSIIIPHYEIHDLLKIFCLGNLYLYSPELEVIIVDNGSKEPLTIDGPHKIIRSEERLSFAAACNMGAKEATGDILIFLNNDCQVLPGWHEPIIEAFSEAKTVICGARLLNQDATIQHVGIAFGKKRLPYHMDMGVLDKDYPESGTKDALAVTGALLTIRASWFKKVGGFAEEYQGGNYEDVDICLAARKQKKKVLVALDSKAIHLGGASYGIHPDEHTDLLVRRNFEIFRKRWKDEPDSFFGIDESTPLLPREEAWGL